MPITLTKETVAEVINLALSGRDHRGVIVDIIDELFIGTVLDLFQQVVHAKFNQQTISVSWYRDYFMNSNLSSREIMQAAGLGEKTIINKRGSVRKAIVLEEAWEHHEKFIALIESLVTEDVNITLSLTFRNVSVELDLNETLIVINAIAVKRATIQGGAWSTAGKQVEGPLMETMCRLFEVNEAHFTRALDNDQSLREVDYYLLPPEGNPVRCEVKLMGKGNPEAADTTIARASKVFVASTLSQKNITQLDSRDVLWTELQSPNGFLRFQKTLDELHIPYLSSDGFSDSEIEAATRQTLAL